MNDAEFDGRLRQLTPVAWAMPLVMLACVGVWIANVAGGMDFMSPRAGDLYRWGGSSASAVQAGEWWRLFTAMFLHGGLLHLALNMYALWEAGLMVTRLFGNRGFLLVYLGTGLVGGALSLHFAGQMNVSVGASGAVFGVIGALLSSVIEHRGRFPGGRGKQLISSLAFFILYSLAYGFANKGIDNAAHIGGLVSGLVAGWLLVEKIDEGPGMAQRAMRFAMTAILLAGGAYALVQAAAPAKRDVGGYFQGLNDWQAAEKAMSASFSAIQEDAAAVRDGKISDPEFVRRLESVHRPALLALERRFAALNLPAGEYAGKFAGAQRRFVQAYADLLETEIRGARETTAGLLEEKERRKKRLDEAKAGIDALNKAGAKGD